MDARTIEDIDLRRPPPETSVTPPTATVRMGEKYVRTLFSDARHKAIYGGRGSAKSWNVATYLAMTTAKRRKRVLCGRQFQNSIRDSSKELIEKRIRQMGLAPQYDITDRTIVHKQTRSDFLFFGLERNIDSIRSLEGVDIVWIEEARTTSAKSMEILLPTIRSLDSELIWTWNPEQPTDPVDAYFRHGQPPPRSIVTAVDYTDNPFFYATALPHEMEVLKRGNYQRYRHVWLGEYDTKVESKIFPNARIGRVNFPDTIPPRYGMDFGFGTDPSFIVKVYVDDINKVMYIAAEAFGRVPLDQLPALIRSVVADDGDLIKADASQPGTIEFLQARGINVHPARKGPGSVKSGILFLQGYDIVIDPNCEGMRDEARLYSWMTDRLTGKILSTPVDANNHGWDAVRYATEDVGISLESDDPDDGVLKLKMW